jgi:protein phosphatase
MSAPCLLQATVGAVTDTGRIRSHNEDCYRVDPQIGFFLVVDGVGGQVAGDVASHTVAGALHQFILETDADEDKTWPFPIDLALSHDGNRLRAAILIANQTLSSEIAQHEHLKGMAATMSALLLADARAVVANIGDCRVYLLRAGVLTQVTVDHSWVAEQIRLGILDDSAAQAHPNRNVVTRALAGESEIDIDVVEFDLAADDAVLLCSDGLSSMVPDEEIQTCLVRALPDVNDACRRLVNHANERGGKDNVTVVIALIGNEPTNGTA